MEFLLVTEENAVVRRHFIVLKLYFHHLREGLSASKCSIRLIGLRNRQLSILGEINLFLYDKELENSK